MSRPPKYNIDPMTTTTRQSYYRQPINAIFTEMWFRNTSRCRGEKLSKPLQKSRIGRFEVRLHMGWRPQVSLAWSSIIAPLSTSGLIGQCSSLQASSFKTVNHVRVFDNRLTSFLSIEHQRLEQLSPADSSVHSVDTNCIKESDS